MKVEICKSMLHTSHNEDITQMFLFPFRTPTTFKAENPEKNQNKHKISE